MTDPAMAPGGAEPNNETSTLEDTEILDAMVDDIPLLAPDYPDLAAVYDGVEPEDIETCEEARRSVRELRDTFLYALRRVRTALAPYGKFKEWCAAAGLNYGTVCNRLSREYNKQQVNQVLTERLEDGAVATVVAGEPESESEPHRPSQPKPRPKPAPNRIAPLKFALVPDERDEVETCLRCVMAGQQFDSREQALVYVVREYTKCTSQRSTEETLV